MKIENFKLVTQIGDVEMFQYKNPETNQVQFFKYHQIKLLSEMAYGLWKAQRCIENYHFCIPAGEPVQSERFVNMQRQISAMRGQIENLQQSLEMVKDEYERSLIGD